MSRFTERAVNILLAVLGLVLASPLLGLIALAVRCDSTGPILFRQIRVGRHGRAFVMYKFRSMRPDAEAVSGPVWTAVADPRITRTGVWLRRTRLDELPQLWNVLAGDMNLVGPRPERPVFVEQLRTALPAYDQRHRVRPGITGWAQIRRGYCASTVATREKLACDLFYIRHRSLWLDLRILARTPKVMVLGRGAR
ncbi:MAG: exopolysaccharide biosynthesis polyprenyl glycosylphosphotransferase [Terriglobales bacterium]